MAEYLGECIESILMQKGAFELIGIDAHSTDSSVDVYKKYSVPILSLDARQAVCLNKAVELAKGKYVGWINSDDYYLPNFLETHLPVIQKNPNISMTYSDVYHLRELEHREKVLYSPKAPLGTLYGRNYIYHVGAFFRKKFLKQVKFDEDVVFHVDWLLYLKLKKLSSMVYIPKPTGVYRVHKKMMTISRRPEIVEEYNYIRSHMDEYR